MSKQNGGNINVLCVNVKDMLRAAEAKTEPQRETNVPKRLRRNVTLYNGTSGNAYMIAGDAKSNPHLPPCSPADGAVLEEILGRPGEMQALPPSQRKKAEEALKKKNLKKTSRLVPTSAGLDDEEKARLKVVPPPPRPHEQGHWHQRMSWVVTSTAGGNDPSGLQHQQQQPPPHLPRLSAAAGDIRLSTHIRGSTSAVTGTSSKDGQSSHSGLPEVSLEECARWVDPIELPASSQVSLDVSSTLPSSSAVPPPPPPVPERKEPELSTVAKDILNHTLTFLDRYKPNALETDRVAEEPPLSSAAASKVEPAKSSTSTNPLASRPPRARKMSSARTFESSRPSFVRLPESCSSSSSSDIAELDEVKRPHSSAYYGPRSGVATRTIPVTEPSDWEVPKPIPEKRRLPFQHLLNQPFEVEIQQIAFESKRHREMNINQFNMKSRRPKYRKAQRNLQVYGLASKPDDVAHYVPGPFKRNTDGTAFPTRRPKKK